MFKIDRRNFLAASSLALYPNILNGEMQKEKGQKSVLLIYLHGGISHSEFTHAVDNMDSKINSATGVIRTEAGYNLGGTFTNLAKHSKKMNVIKSFSHKDANHGSAAAWILTSKPQLTLTEGSQMKEPSYGSLVSRYFGTRTDIGIPTYTKVNKISFDARRDGPGWLGTGYTGFDADEEGINNLKLGIPKERVDNRMKIVEMIDRKESEMDKAWTGLRREAYNVAVGRASEVFDLTKEPADMQTKFNVAKSGFGKSLLMAKRLLQNGSRFVSVVHGGWDMHNDIQKGFETIGPELDYGIGTIVSELERLGLLDTTLVVITTEFGRTYKINGTAGRDHQNSLIPLVFIGGSFDGGRTIGTSERDNSGPKDKIFTPADLNCTIMDFLEIPKHTYFIDEMKRPHHLYEDNSVNILI